MVGLSMEIGMFFAWEVWGDDEEPRRPDEDGVRSKLCRPGRWSVVETVTQGQEFEPQTPV